MANICTLARALRVRFCDYNLTPCILRTVQGGDSATDKGFDIPSDLAKNVRQTAEKLLEWVTDKENSDSFGLFASDLVIQLENCFGSSKSCNVGGRRCGRSCLSYVPLLVSRQNGLPFCWKALTYLLAQCFINTSSICEKDQVFALRTHSEVVSCGKKAAGNEHGITNRGC